MTYYSDSKRKKMTAEEIADRFGIGYYELQIEDLLERISNIRAGKGDCSRGVVYTSKEVLSTPRDRERKMDQLRKRIEDNKRIINEITEAIRLVEQGMRVLEKAEETYALIGALSDDLRFCFKYTEKDKNGERYRPSDTYNAIFVNRFFEDAKSKYRRLWKKEYNKSNRESRKIKRDIYFKLKRLNGRRIVDMSEYGRSDDMTDYISLSYALKENGRTLKGFGDSLDDSVSKRLDYLNFENLASLGVEIEKVKRARAISEGEEERSYDEFGPILKSMEHLASEYDMETRFKSFIYLKEDIIAVDKLSREVECLDLIIDAYDISSIKDSDLFKELIEIYRKQNKKLNSLSTRMKEKYQRSGIKQYVECEQRLRDLYSNSNEYDRQVRELEKECDYSHPDVAKARDLYNASRSEMLGILLKYPELNKEEYGFDLSQYDKKGRYIGDDESKKAETLVTEKPIFTIPKRKVEPIGNNEDEFVPQRVLLDGEVEEAPAFAAEDFSQELVVPYLQRPIRTAYYSKYMVEKVKSSDLGNLSFSEYLRVVAPDLEQLIELEQIREKRAETVFKQYIKYYASVEDKKSAMRFSEFASVRFGLKSAELPFEYADTQIVKKLK